MSDWGVEYLRRVLMERGWTGAELAQRAGVSASTINRPVNTPDWNLAISRKTLEKVAAASGIDFRPYMPTGLAEPAPTMAPARQSGIKMSVDGGTAYIEATVTLATIPELRRKIDLIEALLRG